VDLKELRVVECLLGGRRWVQLQHEEACFEHAKRAIERLIENLSIALSRFEAERLDLSQMKTELRFGNLIKLLELLPHHFFEQLAKTFYLIRSVSIDANNKYNDPDTALAVLDTVRQLAMKSPQLRHKFDEDWKKLQELKSEQDKHAVKLTIGDEPLEIAHAGARFGDRSIRADEVTSLRWGALLNAGGRSGMTQYSVVIGADQGTSINIEWTTRQSKEQDDYFGNINFAALVYLMDHCIANLRKRLDGGARVGIGPAVATKNGLEVKIKGWFSDKDHIINWADLRSDMRAGMLTFSDRTNAKANATMAMKDTDNAIVLHWMANMEGKQ
jgi:hypothetical protein